VRHLALGGEWSNPARHIAFFAARDRCRSRSGTFMAWEFGMRPASCQLL
jgi:hypothetical protein